MLDVSLREVSFRHLRDVSLTFHAGTHTAIIGAPAAGASTLLGLISGRWRPPSGEVLIGTRVVTDLKESRRPLLFTTSSIGVPDRWSVQHALIAAVRQRSLDRVDRQREYTLVVDKWNLGALVARTTGSLSQSERTLVHLARIELLRPGILVADRPLEYLNPAAIESTADLFHRTLRVAGTTVITAPSSHAELGATDRVVVLSAGRVLQEGNVAEVHEAPADETAAMATGSINIIPVTVSGQSVDSAIGSWQWTSPSFEGTGVALVRPEAFAVAGQGAESDLIIAVEEAAFENGRWLVRAPVSGGLSLRISLPASVRVHKGKLLALTYDPIRFTLIPREMAPLMRGMPLDVLAPRSGTR